MYYPEAGGSKLSREKKLLVLDLDNTLCDFFVDNYERPRGPEVARPYLHQFLKTINQYYEIVIWSATNKNALDSKLISLGIATNDSYRILFTLNETDMIQTKTVTGVVRVKPLSIIWRKISEFNDMNTLIVDDFPTNFYLNPRNGVPIKPYYQKLHKTDKELELLTKYLVYIAKHSSHFEKLNHKEWREYVAQIH